jgi:hypothetical protein
LRDVEKANPKSILRCLGSGRFSNWPSGGSVNFGTSLLELGANAANGLEQL